MILVADFQSHSAIEGDNELISKKIGAASQWIETFIEGGFSQWFVEKPAGWDDVPADWEFAASQWEPPPFDHYQHAPEPIREAVRQLAAHLYENREASSSDFTVKEIPFGVLDLIGPYRRYVF